MINHKFISFSAVQIYDISYIHYITRKNVSDSRSKKSYIITRELPFYSIVHMLYTMFFEIRLSFKSSLRSLQCSKNWCTKTLCINLVPRAFPLKVGLSHLQGKSPGNEVAFVLVTGRGTFHYRSSVFPLRVSASAIQVTHYLVSRRSSWAWNSMDSKSTFVQHVHFVQVASWPLVYGFVHNASASSGFSMATLT